MIPAFGRAKREIAQARNLALEQQRENQSILQGAQNEILLAKNKLDALVAGGQVLTPPPTPKKRNNLILYGGIAAGAGLIIILVLLLRKRQ